MLFNFERKYKISKNTDLCLITAVINVVSTFLHSLHAFMCIWHEWQLNAAGKRRSHQHPLNVITRNYGIRHN